MNNFLAFIAAKWAQLSVVEKIYIIGLPASAVVINAPWLTAWLPEEQKHGIQTTAYWLWISAISLLNPWLRAMVGSKTPLAVVTTESHDALVARVASLERQTNPTK